MNVFDFKPRDKIRYIPGVAYGDSNHPVCEDGVVSSINNKYVFVKFNKQLKKFGWEGTTSQSCDSKNLIILSSEKLS